MIRNLVKSLTVVFLIPVVLSGAIQSQTRKEVLKAWAQTAPVINRPKPTIRVDKPLIPLKPVQTIDLEFSDDHMIYMNSSMVQDTAGNFFVWDSKQYKVFKLDPRGKYLTDFCRRGQGPGEISREFAGLHIGKDNSLYIHDPIRKIAKYDLSGNHVADFKETLSFDIFYRCGNIVVDRDGEVLQLFYRPFKKIFRIKNLSGNILYTFAPEQEVLASIFKRYRLQHIIRNAKIMLTATRKYLIYFRPSSRLVIVDLERKSHNTVALIPDVTIAPFKEKYKLVMNMKIPENVDELDRFLPFGVLDEIFPDPEDPEIIYGFSRFSPLRTKQNPRHYLILKLNLKGELKAAYGGTRSREVWSPELKHPSGFVAKGPETLVILQPEK